MASNTVPEQGWSSMNNNVPRYKSKLFKLKEWLTVSEAANHLSIIMGEPVTASDILRLGLDGHLRLSINILNRAYARRGRRSHLVEEWETEIKNSIDKYECCNDTDDDQKKNLEAVVDLIKIQAKSSGGKVFPGIDGLSENITFITGVWDLPMFGGERVFVENEYQKLTGGPQFSFTSQSGVFVEGDDRAIYQFQDCFTYPELIEKQHALTFSGCQSAIAATLHEQTSPEAEHDKPGHSNNLQHYIQACTLPADSILVVRTKAIIDLQERLLEKDPKSSITMDCRSETTYLNIIAAMLETFILKMHGDVTFSSETDFREFLSKKYCGCRGLAESTTGVKFAAAKKSLNEELD